MKCALASPGEELDPRAGAEGGVHARPLAVERDFRDLLLEDVEAFEEIAYPHAAGVGEGEAQLVLTDAGGLT